MEFGEKLIKAKRWFTDVTEADPELMGFMGITPHQLVEMYEREHQSIESNESA